MALVSVLYFSPGFFEKGNRLFNANGKVNHYHSVAIGLDLTRRLSHILSADDVCNVLRRSSETTRSLIGLLGTMTTA